MVQDVSSGQAVAIAWRPVGGRVSRRTSGWWESIEAARGHRTACELVHAMLLLRPERDTLLLEMTPTWAATRHGVEVLATGAVGSRALGRIPFFRYEVRLRTALLDDDGIALSDDPSVAAALVDRAPAVPPLVWGARTGEGDLWTSNSVVAWLLADAGLVTGLVPPPGCRAPGWDAGIAAA